MRWILDAFDWLRWILDAFDWLAHAIGKLYLAQPLTEVDFRKLKVRHPFMMHVTPLGVLQSLRCAKALPLFTAPA